MPLMLPPWLSSPGGWHFTICYCWWAAQDHVSQHAPCTLLSLPTRVPLTIRQKRHFFLFDLRGIHCSKRKHLWILISNYIFLTSSFIKVFGTYPSDKDELMIFRRGSMTSRSISFSGFVGIGSNMQVVDEDELTRLRNLPLLFSFLPATLNYFDLLS